MPDAASRRPVPCSSWEEWSPGWAFDDATFERTAVSFNNPDFVEVVIHCYRFHFGLTPGEPNLTSLEQHLASKPKIGVPAITLDGTRDPLKPGGTADHAKMFTGRHEHRVVDSGHNLPWEAPRKLAEAILTVRGWSTEP